MFIAYAILIVLFIAFIVPIGIGVVQVFMTFMIFVFGGIATAVDKAKEVMDDAEYEQRTGQPAPKRVKPEPPVKLPCDEDPNAIQYIADPVKRAESRAAWAKHWAEWDAYNARLNASSEALSEQMRQDAIARIKRHETRAM